MNKVLFGLATGFLSTALLLSAAGPTAAADPVEPGHGTRSMGLVAYKGIDKSQHVFYRSSDGAIMEMFNSAAVSAEGWHQKNLTTEAVAPKAASAPAAYVLKADKTQHVIYRSTDDQIVELYWAATPGKWQFNNLTTLSKGPKPAGNPCGFVVESDRFVIESDRTQHIVYRTAEGEICELYLSGKPGSTWAVSNLTRAATAPKAASDPCGYSLKDKSRHIVYRDKNGDLQEFFESGSGTDAKWMVHDLTAATKAPKAAGKPHAYRFDDNMTQHIVYRSEGGDVCELYLTTKTGSSWGFNNLSHGTKAPKAAGNPFGYALKGNSQHVVYRDKDGNVQELFNAPAGDKWEINDLTTLTKAPKAASDPTGFALRSDETQHIFYRTSDTKVCEFYHTDRKEDTSWHVNTISVAKPAP